MTSAVVTSAMHAEARSNGPCRAAFPAAESEREMRTMAETNGQVARRQVAGKGIDTASDEAAAPAKAAPAKAAPAKAAPAKAARKKSAPEKVTSTTHVNVALPFAKLAVHEPSEHLLALTTLVQDLAGLLARTTPSPEAEDLLRRAEELAAKIR